MNILIQNAHVLLFEPAFEVKRTDVYVSGSLIASIGQPPTPGFIPDKTLDGRGKLLMPGLVNCHTHLYMTVMRNYADDLSFGEWLFERIMPKEDLITPEDAYWCNLLSCLEMIRSGTTCYLDMHMFRHQSIRASQEAGMRAILSRGIVGDSADDDAAISRLQDTLDELDAAGQHDGRVHCMLGPHAIYTCGEALLCHLRQVALEKGLRLHIHLAETQTEFNDAMEKYGCSPTEYLARLGVFDAPTVAAHGVYLTDNDIAILKQYGVSIATNPVSNMKLGNGFAPIPKLLK
ncbi:MAG: amidohydrolase family protein, partial [Ruminococcaceae bacterium]|nr:amidohydrolase family protein [Oscillospiraceae bacterium]